MTLSSGADVFCSRHGVVEIIPSEQGAGKVWMEGVEGGPFQTA